MNRSAGIRTYLTSAVLLLSFSSAADAQSLTRLQGPGGRQIDGPYVQLDRFLPGDRWALCTISDGIVPGDTNGLGNAALYDLWTGDYSLLVTGAGGAQLDGAISVDATSANGDFVTLQTDATNLGWPDTNGFRDVCLLDRASGSLQRVSLGQGGVEPDEWSGGGEVSDDGRWVVFYSEGRNLLPGDTNDEGDVFVRDMSTGNVELISTALGGGFANRWSYGGEMSADGRFVLFTSWADNLVIGDLNGFNDLFLRDRQNGTTVRLNLGPAGTEANGGIETKAGMTPDARWVFFDSPATNLHPNANGQVDVFLLDRQTGLMILGSEGLGGVPSNGLSYSSGLSDDGRKLAFMSSADNIDPSDNNYWYDEFHLNLTTGTTKLISRSTAGNQGQLPPGYGPGHMLGRISPSGRLASFYCNLRGLVAGDTNLEDTFLYDASSPCAPIEGYCAAKLNSLGCTPAITSGGEPYTSGPSDAFFVSAHNLRNTEVGIFIWSRTESALPFFGGTLCLAPPVWRTPGQDSGGSSSGNDCSGTYSFHFTQAHMAFKGIGPGTLVHGQFWSRDGGLPPPNNVGLTGGLRFVTSP